MKQEVLRNFDITWLPITGLILFFICFALFVYFTYQKRNKHFYTSASLIPLQDAEKMAPYSRGNDGK